MLSSRGAVVIDWASAVAYRRADGNVSDKEKHGLTNLRL
jgi:hypothetical protein